MDKFLGMLKWLVLSFLTFTFIACVSSSKHEELQSDHDKLQTQYNQSKTQIAELETLIAELERKLGKASSSQKTMSQSIDHMKNALKEASERKRDIEKRMSDYKKLVRQFKSLTEAGDLSIKIKDGRMVVAMPSDVLFSSGSAKLSSKGRGTIQKVSSLLVTIPEKKFQIEGHTDNVPIKSARFPSNWELASARALNVLNTMTTAGMPKSRISAASFADTRPEQDNQSKAGKQANRRIEIVLMPDLSLLPGYEELKRLSGSN